MVLPCEPAMATPYLTRISSASISARAMTGMPQRARLDDLGIVRSRSRSSRRPRRRRARSRRGARRRCARPSSASRSVMSFSFRSEPETSNSSVRRISARPLMPMPPMPTKWTWRTRPRNIGQLPLGAFARAPRCSRSPPRSPATDASPGPGAARDAGELEQIARDPRAAWGRPSSRAASANFTRARIARTSGDALRSSAGSASSLWADDRGSLGPPKLRHFLVDGRPRRGSGTRIDGRPTAQSSAIDPAPARPINTSAPPSSDGDVVDEWGHHGLRT